MNTSTEVIKVIYGKYFRVYLPNHPAANKRGYVLHSHLIAENVLGKYLPAKAVVHHINENTFDDSPKNLVICEDDNYHRIIHMRMNALKACGNVHWRPCSFCGKYDDLKNLNTQFVIRDGKTSEHYHHTNCKWDYEKRRKKLQKDLGVMGSNYGI